MAIGKNTTGENTADDFSDIDTLLSMTSFADSVSNIFTNSSGDIRNTTSIMIFNNWVNDVPIANSTNNTNFQTGILWDSSDDSDGEYSQGDKEDLVFITELNKGKVGAYGTYDYEIRIPAKLREYYNTDSRKVVFYSDLR